MIKVKDGYAKLIGTTYQGIVTQVLLSNGGTLEYSDTSKASTLVKRNASQHIYATFFNSAISDEALSDIGSIYVRNTSDNYIRRVNKAQFYSILDDKFITCDTIQNITGVKTFSNSPRLSNNAAIIQNQNNTDNYTTILQWYKNGVSQDTYNPSIGQHNIGGDGKGSICILPYPTSTHPVTGNVGLFISKGVLKLDGKSVSFSDHSHNFYLGTTLINTGRPSSPLTLDSVNISGSSGSTTTWTPFSANGLDINALIGDYRGKSYYAPGSNSSANNPFGAGQPFGLQIWKTADGTTGHVYMKYDGSMYVRAHAGNTWTSLMTILNSSNTSLSGSTVKINNVSATFSPSNHRHNIDNLTDLHGAWDSLLKTSPSAYVTRWPSWGEIIGKPALLAASTPIPADVDLNSYLTEGFYYCSGSNTAASLTNCPTKLAFSLSVFKHAGCNQRLIEYITPSFRIFTRNYYNGSWSPWHLEYTSSTGVPWDKITSKPSTFIPSAHTHNSITNSGRVAATALPSSFTGLQLHSVYGGSFPQGYGNVITIKGDGSSQIFVTWNSSQSPTNPNVSQDMYIRSRRDIADDNWSVWTKMITDKNYSSTLDSRYYTKTESDSRYLNTSGDYMTGYLLIKGPNGYSNSASIHLALGDSDTGFKWIRDGVLQMYANNIAIGQWDYQGMNWYKTPKVNGVEVSLSNHTHSNYVPTVGNSLITTSTYYGLTLKRSTSLGSAIQFSNSAGALVGIGVYSDKTLMISSGSSTSGDMFKVTVTGKAYAGGTELSKVGHTHNYAASDKSGGDALLAKALNYNSRMDYGWSGLNYFNLYTNAGCVAKVNDTPTTNWWHIIRLNHGNSAGYYTDLAVPFGPNGLYYKSVTAGVLRTTSWVRLIDSDIIGSQTVAKANQLTNSQTIFGKSFNGTASVAGQGQFYGNAVAAGQGYLNGAILIREANQVGNSQSTDQYAPRISFRWANRFGCSMIVNNNEFKLLAQNETTYASIRASRFITEGSSRDYAVLGDGTTIPVSTFMRATHSSGFYGLTTPAGSVNDWIRSTNSGFIPYQSGGRGSGHSSIGTSSWYFKDAYIDTINCVNINGNIASATNADKVDNYHAGNSSGQVAVSNGILCNNLNAQKFDNGLSTDYFRTYILGDSGEYLYSVILLFKDSELTNHRIMGKVYHTHTNGNYRFSCADIDVWFTRWSTSDTAYADSFYLLNHGQTNFELVTCTYGGEKWWALKHTTSQAGKYQFVGTKDKASLTIVSYYKSNPATVINSEINGSIQSRNDVIKRMYNGTNQIAYTTDTIAKANQLANSRTINGTAFNGTANITTSYWGTTRTISLTGAVTGSVSTNGGSNININTSYSFSLLDGRFVGGNKSADHSSKGTAYTADTYSSTYVNKAFVAFAERGSWNYARNGYVVTDTGVNIPLAGTAIFQWGASDTQKTQLYITPAQSAEVSNPANNEMLFYTSNGSGYTSAWTRVITNRNINRYLPTSLKNPYSLILQTNGITQTTYDGSVTKTVNITLQNAGSDLVHNSLGVLIKNVPTDSGWNVINERYGGYILRAIRAEGTVPSWILGGYSAGICFGGSDTKAVISCNPFRPVIKFAGGNGSKPVWWMDLIGQPNAIYDLSSFVKGNGGAPNQGVYVNNGVVTPMPFHLNASVEPNTLGRSCLAQYNTAGNIEPFTKNIGDPYTPIYLNNGIPVQCAGVMIYRYARYYINTRRMICTKVSGNYIPIKNFSRLSTGMFKIITTIALWPSDDEWVFATGIKRFESNGADKGEPCYVSVNPAYSGYIISIADDNTKNEGELWLYFLDFSHFNIY